MFSSKRCVLFLCTSVNVFIMVCVIHNYFYLYGENPALRFPCSTEPWQYLRSLRWMGAGLGMMYGPLFSMGLTPLSVHFTVLGPWNRGIKALLKTSSLEDSCMSWLFLKHVCLAQQRNRSSMEFRYDSSMTSVLASHTGSLIFTAENHSFRGGRGHMLYFLNMW